MQQLTRPIVSVITLSLAILVSACNPTAETGVVPRDQPVKVVGVSTNQAEPLRTFPGRVAAADSSNVASKVAGQITQINVQPGDEINMGDVLLELDQTDYQLNLDQAQANFNLAKVSYERQKSSYDKGITTQANFDSAKANYDLARVSLTLAQNQLADTKIRAQFNGLVVRVNPKVNDFIGVGQPLMYLQSNKDLDVKFQVPSDIVARIDRDIDKQVVKVIFDALPTESFAATVKEFSADSDRSTRSFDVTLTLPLPPGDRVNLLPGMDATVLIDLSQIDGATVLTVPSHTVFKQGGKNYVWRLNNKQVQKTEVELGNLLDENIEIKSGVSAGDMIVAAGIHKLTDGQIVSVWREE
jgi:RND family efflux transporter MFP subunit